MAYAVLSFGGFMGMGNKLFAMPWEAFEFSATENKLILNVDKEKLKTAPGFDKDGKWPDFSDTTLGREHLQLLRLRSPLEVVGSTIRALSNVARAVCFFLEI